MVLKKVATQNQIAVFGPLVALTVIKCLQELVISHPVKDLHLQDNWAQADRRMFPFKILWCLCDIVSWHHVDRIVTMLTWIYDGFKQTILFCPAAVKPSRGEQEITVTISPCVLITLCTVLAYAELVVE